jgi:UDP-N-acetylmuramoyl-L-alanyl-D-glutamate--2,6-diaminopimelate ligase
MLKKLNNLLIDVEIIDKINFADCDINGIAYNSQKVESNFIFVAIRGLNSDGNNYLDAAIVKGASVIITSVKPQTIDKNITYIIVENERKTLAIISANYYNFQKGSTKFIGITGTNGKTTITFLFKSFLSKFDKKCAIIGTTGIYFGEENIPSTHTTPESFELFEIITKLQKAGAEYIIMEVSSHSLMQYRTYGIDFDIAIFTNLTHDHLDYHQNMENYAQAKQLLFKSLNNNALTIVNSDDKYSYMMIDNTNISYKISVGTRLDSDFIISKSRIESNQSYFELFDVNKRNNITCQTNLIGAFNISNLSLVVVALIKLEFKIDLIEGYCKDLTPAPGRMEVINLKNGAIGVVDYAHTPDALDKVLDTLNSIKAGKIITLFGCGGERDRAKRPEMGKIATKFSDYTIITNDNPRNEDPKSIINDIISGINEDDKSNYTIIEDRELAIKNAYELSNKGDIILVAGKGHEDYQILGNQRIHFSDIEQLRKFI